MTAGQTNCQWSINFNDSWTDKLPMDYPNGIIAPLKPGEMSLKPSSGGKETFYYEIKGDIMELNFERAPGVGLVRIGSEAEKRYGRRMEPVKLDGKSDE